MSFNLICRVTSPDSKERPKVKMNLADGLNTVGDIRDRAVQLCDGLATKEDLQLLLTGRILRDDSVAVSSLNLKSYSCVYAVKRPQPPPPCTSMEPKTLTEPEIDQFFIAFGVAMRNPNLTKVVKKLNERENLASMAAACPGLAQDQLAMALLSKPEMLQQLLKPKIVKKIAKEHPALYEAMVNLAASVHEEKSGPENKFEEAVNVNPFTYHLDEMSDGEDDDDEDMDEAEQAYRRERPVERNSSFTAITPNQLAAAIAAAQGSTSGTSADAGGNGLGGAFGGMLNMGGTPSSSSASSSRPTPSSPLITQDMFRNAMEQALAASGVTGIGASSSSQERDEAPAPMDLGGSNPAEPDYTEQINRMKEMGIVDEALARKALKVMNGDLQNAIDLIFSGWAGEED